MSIIDLIEADGGTLKRTATTNGGEFAGACPFCGGKDRFRVWPEQDGGRYWCRGCEKSGDSIQYLRERRGLSFRAACDYLGREPGPRSPGLRTAPAAWEPRETTAPLSLWQERARAFLDKAIGCLWSERGESMRAWLHAEKGLHAATIKAAGLGLALADTFEPRGIWGLAPSLKEDGTERRQWLPGGLVIPLTIGGAVHRLRIRRDDPGDGPRYVVVSGSGTAPLIMNQDGGAGIIVESELDALLLNQEAGDFVFVVAMGTATAKPDIQTHTLLKEAPLILIALDTDEAGAKATWRFWPETYGKRARRWPSIKGKDASEARLNGLDLRAWVLAGIFNTDAKLERFCIQTIDGGMTDSEALEVMAR